MKSTDTSARRALSKRAGRGLLAPIVVVLVAAGGYGAWRYMNAGRPPSLPQDLSGVDPEVAALVRKMVAEIEAEPANGRKHGSLGLAYEANTMWPEAVTSFANAAALDSSEPLWNYHCARAMINAGDQEGGYALLLETARQVPNVAGVQLYLAHQLLEAGEFDLAQTALNHVVRLKPDSAQGYAGQGELLVEREDYAGAARLLRRALEIDPNCMIAHYSLGLAYRGMGQLKDAERELALGLGAKRGRLADKFGAETQEYGVNYVGVINKSSDLVEAGAYQAAVNLLERLRKTRPDDTNLLNNLGIAYIRMKRLEPALKHLLHALALDDTFFGTHQNLSACYQDMGDLDKALVHAQRAVELGGDVSSTHFALLRILARKGRFADALVNGKAAVRLDPGDPMKHAALGELYAQLRRPRDAGKSFQAALALSPGFTPARVNLLRILIGLGDLTEAEKVLAKGEALTPSDVALQQCRDLLLDARRRRAPKRTNK